MIHLNFAHKRYITQINLNFIMRKVSVGISYHLTLIRLKDPGIGDKRSECSLK